MTLNKETFNDLWEAWHKVKREGHMETPQQLVYVKPLKMIANRQQGTITEVSIVDYGHEYVVDKEGTYYNFGEITPLRATGLTDTNGEPIYEGSIVKFEDDLRRKSGTFTGKVKYRTRGYFAGSFVVNYTAVYKSNYLGDMLAEKYVEVVGWEPPEIKSFRGGTEEWKP